MLLALHFRQPNVDAFLNSISREQFKEWAAYYCLQPFGDLRGDLQAAKVAQAMAGGTLQDHMLFIEEEHGDMAAIAALYQ